jgi:hypothetical protein
MPSRQWFFADAEFSRDLVRGQIIREQRGFDASLECLATDYRSGGSTPLGRANLLIRLKHHRDPSAATSRPPLSFTKGGQSNGACPP